MVLKFIPRQERCCFCVFSLKVAAIIAVIFSIIIAVYDMTVVHLPLCRDLFKGKETIFRVLLYFSYVRLVGGCLTLLFALLFFVINVILKKPFECTADCFVVQIVVTLFIRSVCIALMWARLLRFKHKCNIMPVLLVDILMFMFLTIIIFDFAISVNGYNFEMKTFGGDTDDDDEDEENSI